MAALFGLALPTLLGLLLPWRLEAGPLQQEPAEDSFETPGVDLLQRRQSVEKRPNILLIVLDQWRGDFDGFGDAQLDLPIIRSLADRGLRFTRAYAASPSCAPSRAALALGREFQHSPVHTNWGAPSFLSSYPERPDTFPTLLREAGYVTMLTGKDHLINFQSNTIAADMQSVGFDFFLRTVDKYNMCNVSFPTNYTSYLKAVGGYREICNSIGLYGDGTACNATRVCDNYDDLECGFRCEESSVTGIMGIDEWTRKSAQTLLAQHWRAGGPPFFLQVNFPSPHPPFNLPSSQLQSRRQDVPSPVDADSPYHWKPSESDSSSLVRIPKPSLQFQNFTQSRANYAGLIELLDSEIGQLLEYLESVQGLRNTIVFVTGDHGEHLGDHGEWSKCSPWEVSLRVPLIAAGPGVLPGRVETAPVSLIDLAATFLELGGLEVPEGMDSHSLVPALVGSGPPTRRVVLSGLRDITHAQYKGQMPAFFEVASEVFNASSMLKLVCCPLGCIKQGSMLPVTMEPQVALMNVTEGEGEAKFEHDVLNKPHGRGVAEALHLMQFLSNDSQSACLPVLNNSFGSSL